MRERTSTHKKKKRELQRHPSGRCVAFYVSADVEPPGGGARAGNSCRLTFALPLSSMRRMLTCAPAPPADADAAAAPPCAPLAGADADKEPTAEAPTRAGAPLYDWDRVAPPDCGMVLLLTPAVAGQPGSARRPEVGVTDPLPGAECDAAAEPAGRSDSAGCTARGDALRRGEMNPLPATGDPDMLLAPIPCACACGMKGDEGIDAKRVGVRVGLASNCTMEGVRAPTGGGERDGTGERLGGERDMGD